MKQLRAMMGMPITVEIVDSNAQTEDIDAIFDYFDYIDQTFSTYKTTSEISQINRGEIKPKDYSLDMKTIFALAKETTRETNGFFNIDRFGRIDPSGVVKGWAIRQAAEKLHSQGFKNFYIEAGGDIQVQGINAQGKKWRIGIRNPFNKEENVKIIELTNAGIATSGTYERGQHVYNPKNQHQPITKIVSLTVIGSNICDADRFATGAFAMGKNGINFIEQLPGFEGYLIDQDGLATLTTDFEKYLAN